MEPSRRNELTGHLAALSAIIFFALNIPATAYILKGWIEPAGYTTCRLLGGVITAWIISAFIKNTPIDWKKDGLTIILGGIIGMAIFFYIFSAGLFKTSPIDASIILTLSPVLVLIISAIVFKEQITKRKSLGILLALAGALMVILMQHQNSTIHGALTGNLLMLASTVIYAVYLIISRGISSKYNPVTLLRWIFLSGLIVALPFGFSEILHSPMVTQGDPKPILVMLFIAFFPSALSYMLIPIALKRLSSTIVSMYSYLIPVIASAVSILLGQAVLEWFEPVSLLLIVVGVYFVTITKKKNSVPKK